MAELASALDAREAAEVFVDQHVVVEAVLARERVLANEAQVGLDSCMASVVVDERRRRRELFILADFADEALLSVLFGFVIAQLRDVVQSHFLKRRRKSTQ